MLKNLRDWYFRKQLGTSGKYLDVKGHAYYYETYGNGEPLYLFHGGMSTVKTFRCQVPDLLKNYYLILPERKGHGHTADTPGDYSYESMADDMIDFMKEFGTPPSHVLGHSDGANLIFYMALKAPELIKKCVIIGGNFHYEGCVESHQEEMRQIPQGYVSEDGTVDEYYAQHSPDGPDHYANVFDRVRKLWLTQPTLTVEELKKITVPTLVVSGDKDVITLQHTAEMVEAMPHAELCVLPNTSHGITKEKPEILNHEIMDFLSREISDEEEGS